MTLEASLVEHCSPTMAGLKVANLYRFSPADRRQFALQYKLWREWFASLGLCLSILKGCRKSNSYLLYLYRPNALAHILQDPDNRAYLYDAGYDPQASDRQMLAHLARRLCFQQAFPHEIGIFLGYPLEDVKGFVQNKGKNFTCCGYWKVYGDPDAAKRRFARYRTCTAIYKRRYASGTPITQLIVAA